MSTAEHERLVRVCFNCRRSLYKTYKQWGEYWSYKKKLFCSKSCVIAQQDQLDPVPASYEEPLRHV